MQVRQSTARTIVIGPVLDADGVAKTDEVVASVKIHKNGGAAGALDGSATLTHSQTGFYLLALTANDLDTLGVAEFSLNSGTNSMPVKAVNVLTQAAWDALHHATEGKFRSDLQTVKGRDVGDVGEGNTADLLKSADTGATAVARPGDKMDLVDAPNETAVAALQDGLSTHAASDVAALILVTPANKLTTDEDGYVTAENMRGTDDAALASELDKVPKSDGDVTWNATALASVNAEVDTALEDDPTLNILDSILQPKA